MDDTPERLPDPPPLEGAPTWVRIIEAAIVGVIAGLALHALLSVLVLHGQVLWPSRGNAECKKTVPVVRELGARS